MPCDCRVSACGSVSFALHGVSANACVSPVSVQCQYVLCSVYARCQHGVSSASASHIKCQPGVSCTCTLSALMSAPSVECQHCVSTTCSLSVRCQHIVSTSCRVSVRCQYSLSATLCAYVWRQRIVIDISVRLSQCQHRVST